MSHPVSMWGTTRHRKRDAIEWPKSTRAIYTAQKSMIRNGWLLSKEDILEIKSNLMRSICPWKWLKSVNKTESTRRSNKWVTSVSENHSILKDTKTPFGKALTKQSGLIQKACHMLVNYLSTSSLRGIPYSVEQVFKKLQLWQTNRNHLRAWARAPSCGKLSKMKRNKELILSRRGTSRSPKK